MPAPPPLQPGAIIRFKKLSIEEGLSQSVVTSLAQDRTGFLWLGTTNGLNRFDGYSFTIFKPEPSNPDSLSDGWITALLADEDGSLWIGTSQGGLNRYNPASGTFTHYQNSPDDPRSLTAGAVNVVYRDGEGSLWVGTGEGLNRLEPSTATFTRFVNGARDPTSLGDNKVSSIFEDSARRLWIGTNNGLDLYQPAAHKFQHFTSVPDDPATLSHPWVTKIAEDGQGQLWVATAKGLNRFDAASGKFVRNIGGPDSMLSGSINTLLVDRLGALWIGTQAGLGRYDPATRQLRHFHSNTLMPDSLSVDVVFSILEDREGVLWFGTWGGGVNKYDPAQNQFAFHAPDPDDPARLSGGGVFPIFVDADGTAWLGAFGQGLQRFDPRTGVVTRYKNDPKDPYSLGGANVWSILRDRAGTLWLGTSAGLAQLDEASGVFKHHAIAGPDADDPNAGSVMSLYEDRLGHLWVGTPLGLYQYNRESQQFSGYSDPAAADRKTPLGIQHISEDHLGNLWIGTRGAGLYYFDVPKASFTRFAHAAGEGGDLSDNFILWTYEDASGIVWIATAGNGLDRYDPQTGEFASYTEEQGLANNFIYCILPDEQGFLWMATNRGVSRLDPKRAAFQNYTVEDGLQSNEFNSFACARSPDGSMYMGGLSGFNRFFPADLRSSAYRPPVVLTAFKSEGEAGSAAPFRMQELTLRAPHNTFEFEFASLGFSQPQRTRYAYLLDGFDSDWVEIGPRRDGRYTNLPGGNYVLRLRATNRDGTWVESGSATRVAVIPPFWQTTWFAGLNVLLAAAAVYGVYRVRILSVERQKTQLERQVQERTLEIEKLFEQTKELAIIEERNRLARELHDSAKQKAFAALAQLGTANGLIRQDTAAAQAHLHEAENLVSDVIQELTFLIQEMYPLALQEKGLAAVVREYAFEWENRTDIRVSLQIENEQRLSLQVEQALYRILQEAMANIARHSGASQVQIALLFEPAQVALTIADNGQGFDQSQKPKGLGLRSIRERAESVGGEAVINSAPGSGTRLVVRIALKPAEDAARS